jgi:SAM-dependent methyltransferase
MFVCRSCGYTSLNPILSLGRTPLANALLTNEQLSNSEDTYPLDLVFCPNCSLVQITETVSPEKLFSKYFYFSSFSDTVINNSREICESLISRRGLNDSSMVIEVASNDGYLLQNYIQAGIPVMGVEPARNIAEVARKKNVPTICEFFDEKLAEKMKSDGQQADVIHANNVAAHVANLHSFIQGIACLLKPDGVAVIENHYVKFLIDQVEFDAIYHEHLCYYSVTSFKNLFALHGLKLVDVEQLPVHGGSLRVYFQREDGPCSLENENEQHVNTILEEEIRWGVNDFQYYYRFGEKVEALRKNLLILLHKLKNQGKRIAVYGASAKSTTLLSYFGIGRETIDYVVDRSTVKQGYYTPGSHLLIRPPEFLLSDCPDYVLLLTWNFADEILAQQVEYRKLGGKFIIPIPNLQVI